MSSVIIEHSSGAKVTVDLFGATVVSWILPSGKEMFYLSSLCDKERKNPIRGGIPVIFPQFANGCGLLFFIITRGTFNETRICKNINLDK